MSPETPGVHAFLGVCLYGRVWVCVRAHARARERERERACLSHSSSVHRTSKLFLATSHNILTLSDWHQLAGYAAQEPPSAVEHLQEGGRHAEDGHDDSRDGQVGYVHVARVAILFAA